MQDQDKEGRKLEQNTRDGTSSAATMGTGGTGRTGTDEGYDEAANRPWEGTMQSAGRTDDLLSDGSDADQDGKGFTGQRGQEQTNDADNAGNRSGSGTGNRQSEEEHEQSLSGGGRRSDPTGLQGAAGNQQSGDPG